MDAYGRKLVLYVTHATDDHPAFSVRIHHPGLLVGFIDQFAPQNGQLICNDAGWEAVCRRALFVLARPDEWRQAVRDGDEPVTLRRIFATFNAADPPSRHELSATLSASEIGALAQAALDAEAWALAEGCVETM